MTAYEHNGTIYNLDQLISVSEETETPPGGDPFGKSVPVLRLLFVNGRVENVPVSERRRIRILLGCTGEED